MRLSEAIAIIKELGQDLWPGEILDDDERARRKAASSKAAEIAKDGIQPFPGPVRELIAVLNDRNYDLAKAIRMLESDPPMASRVLALANSAAFVARRPASSVRQAFMMLGAQTVQELVIAVQIEKLFEDTGGVGRRIARHCSRTAAITRAFGKVGHFSMDHMYLCALLHDIGKLLFLQSGEFVYDHDGHMGARGTSYVAEQEKLGFDHATLGAIAVRAWEIRDPVARVVAWHHQPSRAFERGGDVAHMVALLRVCEVLEEHVDATVALDLDTATQWVTEPGFAQLDVNAANLVGLWEIGLRDVLLEAMAG